MIPETIFDPLIAIGIAGLEGVLRDYGGRRS
jgi:hypothetical protein